MAVTNNLQGSGLSGSHASDLPKQAVNVSDSMQMENNFISLMVAQIKYQDPTKPVDSTEFLNQFSAMSQVKSMENLATVAKNNLVLTDNLQTLTAAGLVGQQVSVAIESLDLGGQAVSGGFDLSHASPRTA
ncbi:MAG TPA: flagellar basal body rod modification protein, partial [Pseudomonas sp.]|nr:flagellar basal body rod modification protein [Pseudomonas sp.]